MKRTPRRLARLRALLARIKVREHDYFTASNNIPHDAPERPRYEGIATGTRWCREDLEKLLK